MSDQEVAAFVHREAARVEKIGAEIFERYGGGALGKLGGVY